MEVSKSVVKITYHKNIKLNYVRTIISTRTAPMAKDVSLYTGKNLGINWELRLLRNGLDMALSVSISKLFVYIFVDNGSTGN